MDLIDSQTCRKGGDDQIEIFHHFSHQHPLVLDDHPSFAGTIKCFGCDHQILEEDGGTSKYYGCKECKFYLHKKCAELELSPQIHHHPFHPKHLLSLLPKAPYEHGEYCCDFCDRESSGFVYHCNVCKFDLHIDCALLPQSIAPNFPNSFHPHPLFFLPNHDDQVKDDCYGCKKPLSGPIYHCADCPQNINLKLLRKESFGLHKECAELPHEINHPYDRNHPLTLLPKMPTHPQNCGCYLCKIKWEGFVYSCSLCNFDLTLDDFLAPPTITDPSHEHPWILLSRRMSFICDFCGSPGDHTLYLCTRCNLVVHKKCISMPRKIMITRHPHVISHSFSLPEDQFEDWMCRICYEEVTARYGSYRCAHSSCNYIAHVLCATNKDIWDGTIIPEDYDEISMEGDSSNLITDVFEQVSIGEQMVAVEIKHAYHDHNLRLVLGGEIKDYDHSQCDGCMRPISTPFYSCDQCKFFIHKDCAELPREKRHPFHKHLLTLTISDSGSLLSRCGACHRPHHGFIYKCHTKDCDSRFECDLRCILLSDTLKHPSHEHSLFLVHTRRSECSGCFGRELSSNIAYRCTKHCDFTLDMKCATEPLRARFKYDRHHLTLTYSDDSSPFQHFCDLCEEERDPKDWFYHCDDCDNSLHSKCALGGRLQFMKVGSKIKSIHHQHQLIIVKNIWNCPPCKVCSSLCNGTALECKESKCNFTLHLECSPLLVPLH